MENRLGFADLRLNGSGMQRKDLLILMLLSLIIQGGHWMSLSGSVFFTLPQLDERYYLGFAEAIRQGGDLSTFGGFRPMLYPLLAALTLQLDGSGALLLLLQHGLGVLMAPMIAYLASALCRSRAAGWIAGGLWIGAGPPLFYQGQFLLVSLLVFLITGVFLLLVKGLAEAATSRGPWWFAAAGTTAGLAVQVRPNALLFLILFVGFGCWSAVRRNGHRAAGYLAAAMAMTMVLTAFGYVNQWQSGRFQLLTGAGGINLYTGNRVGADGFTPTQGESVTYAGEYRDSIQVYAEQEFERTTGRSAESASVEEISTFWTRKAIEEIVSDPVGRLGLFARKCLLLLWNHEIPNNKSYAFFAREVTPLLAWMPTRWWLLLALGIPGWGLLLRCRPHPAAPLMVVFAFLYAAGIVVFFVNSRFRLPLWPVLCIGAGAWPAMWKESPERWRQGAAVAALLLSLLSLVNWTGVQPEQPGRDQYFYSKALMARGRFDEGLEHARKAAELQPGNPDVLFQLGNSYLMADEPLRAVQVYDDLVLMEPREARLWNNLGVAQEAQQEWKKALAAYRKSLALDPLRDNARSNAVILLMRGERTEAARDLWEKRPSNRPLDIEGLLIEAILYQDLDSRRSHQALEEARSRNPDVVRSLLERIQTPIDMSP